MSQTITDQQRSETGGPSPVTVTRGMRDGAAVHTAALASGLSTRLLPRQVLQVFAPGGKTTAFTHGIPQSSSLSGVTFTQDLRMRRGLLGKAGVPQPRGATFSVGRSRGAAQRFAAKIGYPVVVKPALGDSTIDVTRGIRDRRQFAAAVEGLLTPPEERPGSTQASYGITELRKPGVKDGRVTVPPGYRFLVEEEISGDYLRVLVLEGRVLDVVHCPGGPWSGRASGSMRAAAWPSGLEETAAAVVAALPGLAVLSIDVVVPDSGTRAPVVVDVSERPWLEVQHRCSPTEAARLAREVLTAGLPHTDLPPARDTSRDLELAFEGVIDPRGFVTAVNEQAAEDGVPLKLEVTDAARGYTGGTARSTPSYIATLVEGVLSQGVRGHTAMKADIAQ